MDRIEAMRAFVAVAEEESFARASRRLSLSPPGVTRAVSALEQRLGAQLLRRTTRVVRLTEAGTRFFADCKRILAEIEEAEASAAGSHAQPRGQLALTAPVMFGRMYVAPVLQEFLASHPQVSARLLFLDRVVDLIDEGLDVAVRIAHLPDSSLRAVQLGSVRRVVCAAPGYLTARGRPRTPADLAEYDAIGFSPEATPDAWTFAWGGTVKPRTQLAVNSADVAIAAALAGRGLARVLSYQITPALRAGKLEVVLADYEPSPVPVSLVYAEGQRAAAKIRAFVDFAAERLRAELR